MLPGFGPGPVMSVSTSTVTPPAASTRAARPASSSRQVPSIVTPRASVRASAPASAEDSAAGLCEGHRAEARDVDHESVGQQHHGALPGGRVSGEQGEPGDRLAAHREEHGGLRARGRGHGRGRGVVAAQHQPAEQAENEGGDGPQLRSAGAGAPAAAAPRGQRCEHRHGPTRGSTGAAWPLVGRSRRSVVTPTEGRSAVGDSALEGSRTDGSAPLGFARLPLTARSCDRGHVCGRTGRHRPAPSTRSAGCARFFRGSRYWISRARGPPPGSTRPSGQPGSASDVAGPGHSDEVGQRRRPPRRRARSASGRARRRR